MLNLVLGRSGYGKTEYVFSKIKSLILDNQKDILLITPEQYSLIAERRLLTDLGESGISCVENSSFSRISNDVKRLYGTSSLPSLTKGGKVILMTQAIELSRDRLILFNKKTDTLSFVSSMIKIYDEMKSCNLTSNEILEKSENISNDVLKRKLFDISQIMNAYEQIIADRYFDPSDELTRVYNIIKDKNYFKGKKVFIDGFNGFVAQEYKLLELVISEADCVTLTLCTDLEDTDDEFNLFAYVNNSAQILERIAKKAGVECTVTKLEKNYRAQNSELEAVEKYIFSSSSKEAVSSSKNCRIYSAKNISDECANTSREIKKLMRNGYKASEIAVITRDIEKYRDELSYNLKKYGVPYFNDERQPVANQPLIVLIKYLLRCVNYSFKSDDVLSLAKTGLTEIADADINELENYVYLWNINGMKWTKPFTNSTKGFAKEITKADGELLEKINKTRSTLIEPILVFKNALKKRNAEKICKSIYYTILSLGADKKIRQNAVSLSENGFYALAQEQGRVWDLVMEILNQMAVTITHEINLKDFERLFSLIVDTEDLGTASVGIDNVQFGQADRIRTDNPRAVFILGANEGEFPQTVSGGGLLTENERRIMLDNDFKLYSYGKILNLQERYFAYTACTCASERLFVSYTGNTGKEPSPSEIITNLKAIIPNAKEYTYFDIDKLDLIETETTAFELMSEHFSDNDTFYASLKEYFKDNERFNAVKSLAENESTVIKDRKTSTQLFDYNMYVSASRLEDFYNCPFRYFCKFGLSAKPRERAEIDPMQRGTIIHYVLEKLISDISSNKLSDMPREQLTALVDKYMLEYFENEMGTFTDADKKFKYNYNRLAKLVYSVVFHLSEEFSQSDFEANAFELSIDKDGEVKPEIISLDDGGTVQIRGSIDRVDTYIKNDQRYVRVVDYKSGNKSFNLSDIMFGLNLQMFVYLFSLCEDKSASLSGIPAGVLYMHASRNIFPFNSKAEAKSNLSSEESSSFKMKGLVLDDGEGIIPSAMENDLSGKYIPVKMRANGTLSGSLASLEQLGLLHKKINSLIAQMGNELHNGSINQSPVKNKNHKLTCDFCDYSDVCANKKYVTFRVTPDYSDDEVFENLEKEFDENA